MPYLWTEPEVAAEVDGVKIYHTYKNGNEVMDYWYTADPTQDDIEGWCDGPDYQFDIRDIELPRIVRDEFNTRRQSEYIIVHQLVKWPEDEE